MIRVSLVSPERPTQIVLRTPSPALNKAAGLREKVDTHTSERLLLHANLASSKPLLFLLI